MKGVIFRAFESFVCDAFGDEAFEVLLSKCPLKTQEAFVGPGTYPDEDLMGLVAQACTEFGVSSEDAQRLFGRFLFNELASRFSRFVERHDNPASFLATVDSVIHVEVNKLYQGSVTPRVTIYQHRPPSMIVRYESPRRLCLVADGLLQGVGQHFGCQTHIEHIECMHDGAPRCELKVEYRPEGARDV